MNELSERARKIATKAVFSADGRHIRTFDADSLSELIEQALLAERRLAMEEAAKMCTEEYGAFSNTATDHYRRSQAIAAKLRSVATPRGGE